MNRRLAASVFAGVVIYGASMAIAGGILAVGFVRRFGHAPHPHRPGRPGGAVVTRLPFESDDNLGARTAAAVRERGRECGR